MKIDDHVTLNSINPIVPREQINGKEENGGQAVKVQAPLQDRVELSTRKVEIEKLVKVVEAMPEVRTERVNALKQQIAEGSYNIDGVKVAEKMLERLQGSGNSGGAQ